MRKLFDLSFTKFISPTIAKIVYVLAMVGIATIYIVVTIGAFNASTVFGIVVLLVVGPLMALLYLCFVRVSLESLIATIVTAQNTSELVRLRQEPPPPGAQASGFGPPSSGPTYPGP